MNNENQKIREEQKVRVFTKTFNCLKDVLEDEVCKKNIDSQLTKIRLNRNQGPPAGMKFKRSGYDVLSENGHLNYVYFIKEYPLIELKKSKLPSSQRELIEGIVVSAIRSIIEAHSVVIERGLSFRVKDSEKLEVGYILSFNPTEGKISVKLRTGKKFSEVVWGFDETMEKFEKGELVKM